MNKVEKNRRVRFSYPLAMKKLVALLSRCHQKREIANALSLPSSTLYRWIERQRAESIIQDTSVSVDDDGKLLQLLVECEAHGFDFRKEVLLLAAQRGPSSMKIALPVAAQLTRAEPCFGDSCSRNDLPRSPEPAFHANRGKENAIQRASGDARIEGARRSIETRYYSKLSCAALAAVVTMSKWHFIKQFKATYGITPYQYLTKVRVQHAKHLLGTTAYSLEAIAMAVGFDAASSLCRAFRSAEGIKLSAYFKGRKIRYAPVLPVAAVANA